MDTKPYIYRSISIINSKPKPDQYRTQNLLINKEEFNRRIYSTIKNDQAKKTFFLHCVDIIQKNMNAPDSFHKEILFSNVTNILNLIGINNEDIKIIINLSIHQNSTGYFYTNSIYDLLTDLKYSWSEKSSALKILTSSNLKDQYYFNIDLNDIKIAYTKISQELIEKRKTTGKLKNFDFTKANLSNFDFSNLNLSGVDLSFSNLNKSILNNTNLTCSNLSNANLSNANLSNANLNGANLIKANFNYANLSNANLSNAGLCKTKFTGAKLNNANFSGSDLSHADLSNTNLSNANLSNTNLFNAKLYNADLSNANLSNSNLSNSILSNVNLSNVNLENTKLTLDKIFSNLFKSIKYRIIIGDIERDLDHILNHIANDYSLLKTINSINNKFYPLKIKFMEEIIKDFNSLSESQKIHILWHSENFSDILLNNPIYHKSPIINNFIIDYLIKKDIQSEETKLIKFSDPKLNYYSKILIDIMNTKEFYATNSGLVNQILYRLKTSNNAEFEKKSYKIEEKLFSAIPEDFKEKILEILNKLMPNNTFENDETILKDQFLLISNKSEKSYLIVDYEYFEKFMMDIADRAKEWSFGNHVFKNHKNEIIYTDSLENLEDLFCNFKIFQANYLFSQKEKKNIEFISLLKLGEFNDLFLRVLKLNSSKEKFVSLEMQTKLSETLSPLLEYGETKQLNSKFITDILNIYNSHDSEKIEKAKLFLSLSAFFCKLSSSSMFGIEDESPNILREFALCFLNLAFETDGTIVEEESFINWQNRLVGREFSCTSILFDKMKIKLKNTIYFKQIIPSIWL